MIREKFNWLFGPTSVYKVGDTVQQREGGPLMVVIEVIKKRGMSRTLIYCQWHESTPKQTRQNLFPESSLVFFDWYKANKDVPLQYPLIEERSIEHKSNVIQTKIFAANR